MVLEKTQHKNRRVIYAGGGHTIGHTAENVGSRIEPLFDLQLGLIENTERTARQACGMPIEEQRAFLAE